MKLIMFSCVVLITFFKTTHQHVDAKFLDILLVENEIERFKQYCIYGLQQICPHDHHETIAIDAADITNLLVNVSDGKFVQFIENHCRRIHDEYNRGSINADIIERIEAEAIILHYSNVHTRYDAYLRYYLNHQCEMFVIYRATIFMNEEIPLIIESIDTYISDNSIGHTLRPYPDYKDIHRKATLISKNLEANTKGNGINLDIRNKYFQTLLTISLNTCLECRLNEIYKNHIVEYDCKITAARVSQRPLRMLLPHYDVTRLHPTTENIVNFLNASCKTDDTSHNRRYNKAQLIDLINILKISNIVKRVQQIELFYLAHTLNTLGSPIHESIFSKMHQGHPIEPSDKELLSKTIHDICLSENPPH